MHLKFKNTSGSSRVTDLNPSLTTEESEDDDDVYDDVDFTPHVCLGQWKFLEEVGTFERGWAIESSFQAEEKRTKIAEHWQPIEVGEGGGREGSDSDDLSGTSLRSLSSIRMRTARTAFTPRFLSRRMARRPRGQT